MYIMYANASNNTPSYTNVSSYVVWRVHPGEYTWFDYLLRCIQSRKVQEQPLNDVDRHKSTIFKVDELEMLD
jgi:hypothetical protein